MIELKKCRCVLLFGGSFDPPHVAHVTLPPLAMRAVGADAVAYVPAAIPPHKGLTGVTPAHHRLAMLRLAVDQVPDAVVLEDELERAVARPGVPSYTVDTLEGLRARLGPSVGLRLLIGGDSLRQFHTWHRPERILELAEPVVMVRPPDTRQSLLGELPACWDRRDWAGRLIELPAIDVSSTDIRDRVARGLSIAGLVPPPVERYIHEHGLYRPGA